MCQCLQTYGLFAKIQVVDQEVILRIQARPCASGPAFALEVRLAVVRALTLAHADFPVRCRPTFLAGKVLAHAAFGCTSATFEQERSLFC